MKVSVPIGIGSKKMADDLILDIDVVIVEVKENPARVRSIRESTVKINGGEIKIVYDIYLNKKRIRTDMDILRKYNTKKVFLKALEGFRSKMHKSLLSCDMTMSDVVNVLSEEWVFFSDTDKDIIAKIVAGNNK